MYLGQIFHNFCLEICRVSQVMYTALRVFVVGCKVATDILELQTILLENIYLLNLNVIESYNGKENRQIVTHVIEQAKLM